MVLAITVVVLRLLQVAGGGLPISLVHPADLNAHCLGAVLGYDAVRVPTKALHSRRRVRLALE